MDGNSAVTDAEAQSTSGDIEPDNQQESPNAGRPSVDSAEPTEQSELPLDETFELLRNQRRRYVLQYLEDADRQVTLNDLAEHIAAWENDKEVRQITSSERKRVYIGLYQCHLPKMDGMGVISFNKHRGTIERGEHAEAVRPYLHRAAAPERHSRRGPAVGLSVVGISVVPAALLVLSGTVLSQALAAVVVLAAVAWGVTLLWEDSHEGPDSVGTVVE